MVAEEAEEVVPVQAVVVGLLEPEMEVVDLKQEVSLLAAAVGLLQAVVVVA